MTNFISILNKVSIYQLTIPALIGFIYLASNQYKIAFGLLISAIASTSYTQLIKLSNYNKTFAMLGFPVRLILVGIPTAILVHKLDLDLIALFTGFLLCQIIYFLFIWSYAKRLIIDNK